MQVIKHQIIVSIVAHDASNNSKISLTNKQQLDELERNYATVDVASVEVEFINDQESINGTPHRSIMKKHYDSLEQFLPTARLHYNLAS